jgi:DNA (cytosine-5)-methyltransferase 1
MFGLPIYRHRPFECSHMIAQPEHRQHEAVISPGRMLGDRARVPVQRGITAWQEAGGVGGHMGNVARVRAAMGIPWMTVNEISQAIPPAYTKFIGEQFLDQMARTP